MCLSRAKIRLGDVQRDVRMSSISLYVKKLYDKILTLADVLYRPNMVFEAVIS